MTYDEFVDLVRRMRAAQQHYFGARGPVSLRVACALERQVDAAILQLEQARSSAAQ